MVTAPQLPTVLLVDGDDGLCNALGRGFARRGFGVEIAHSGAAALGTARDRRPAYAVVDLRLPDCRDSRCSPSSARSTRGSAR